MVKGVNRQIIEINYTQNDYIQKAILFVNPTKSNTNQTVLVAKANSYMDNIVKSQNYQKEKKKIPGKAKVIPAFVKLALSGIIGAVATYILFCL